jgi:DNA-binding transcriptional MerR regulator
MPVEKGQLARLYLKEQLSSLKIAKRLGVSKRTILRWLENCNIKRRPTSEALKGRRPWNKIDLPKDMLEELYWKKRLSTKEIGIKLGVSKHAIQRCMSEYEIPKRHTGREKGITFPLEIRKKMLEKRLKSLLERPTKPERKLIEIIEREKLPFIYSGDGKVIIGKRCPDFIHNNGEKRVIEVFGRYWHSPLMRHRLRWNQTATATISEYESNGHACLIIWDDELENEKRVSEKIREFIGVE